VLAEIAICLHNMPMEGDIDRILLTREQIHDRVRAIALDIAEAYNGSDAGLTIVPVLSGSIIFLADLIRELPLKMKIALLQLSSYRGATTAGAEIRTVLDLVGDVAERHVLIVDDILDSGRTIRHVQNRILAKGPASVRTAVLLRKPDRAPPDIRVEHIGFDIEDAFVVGYGLDYDDHYRNFPHIGVLKPQLLPVPQA
jgi:hypoxanthine phosphoribosyltransferase